jgi:hypothetical protein
VHPNRSFRVFAASFAAGCTFALASPALAQKATKSTSNEAEWVKYDEAASTVTVKITEPGKGPNAKEIKKGSEVTFNVVPTGSVLTRTSVAVNGVKGELTDIQPGKSVLIYWVPDAKKKGEYFAKKIDVVLSEEELDRRYGGSEEGAQGQ